MTELTVSTLNNQTEEATEAKVAEFLQEHQEIEMILPVVIGIFATSRLGLRGANALLANLLIAGISRQIFQQLKKTQTESTTTPPEENNQKQNNEIAQGYSIIHSVPGRIRLKIERLRDDTLFAKRLERLLNENEYVLKVRVNQAAASVAINYEASGASEMELGMQLLNIISRAEAEETITSPGVENNQI
ncbi:MAG: metal ABC transporter ATPase [Gloeocapsa sp. DLM2.Bin57]|nr:MAG: metal ABC transporter ATPase [Gloeocapsa sp. DLM2.Bin57]